MADAQMKFYIDMNGFSSASRGVQSLTNFIMENGSLYIRGEYDNTTHTLDHMSGVVRMTSQPYNYEETGGNVEITPTRQDIFMQYVTSGNESALYKDGVPDCVTKLVSTAAGGVSLKPYSIIESSGTYSISPVSGGFSLSGTITPKIGESTAANTDDTVLPASISHTGTATQICRTAVAGLNSSGSIRYDVQLRTPTFTIGLDDTGSSSFNSSDFVDLYYKIGLVAVNGDAATGAASAVPLIKDSPLNIYTDETFTYTIYTLGDYSRHHFMLGDDSTGNLIIKRLLNDNDFSGLANAMLINIVICDNGILAGFMYARLCTTGGEIYNGTVSGKRGDYWDFFRRESSGATPVQVSSNVSLPLTDQGLDGSFVVWPDTTPPL